MAGKNQINGGAFQDAQGNRLAYGSITMQLSHDEQEPVDPGQVVGGLPVTIPLDQNGNIAGTVSVWPNDQLLPANSFYTVNAFDRYGELAWLSPQNLTIPSSPSPYNIGTAVPAGVAGSTPLILQTNGINNAVQTSLNLVSGPNVTLLNSGANVTVTASSAGGVDISSGRFALWTPGNAGAGDWIVVDDVKIGNDSGATASFQAPTSTTNYTYTQTGNRISNGLFVFYGGRNFTFKACGGVTTGTLGHSSIGLVNSNGWFGGFGGSGAPTGSFVLFDASGATWNCLVGNGTTTTTSTAVSTTTRHLFEIDYTPTSVVFKIDGVTVATDTLTIPATAAMGVCFNSFAAAAGQTFTGEYMYCSQATV